MSISFPIKGRTAKLHKRSVRGFMRQGMLTTDLTIGDKLVLDLLDNKNEYVTSLIKRVLQSGENQFFIETENSRYRLDLDPIG